MPSFCRYAVLCAALALCACATNEVPDTEQMLAAAGFTMEPATTPDVANEIATLPPYSLFMRPPAQTGGAPTYAYADPGQCHCLYVGGPSQYQYFQQLAVQKRIADEQMEAAMMNENAAFMWGAWPPPVVVIHDHRH